MGFSYFRFFYLGFLIISTLMMVGFSLSPNATYAVQFYSSWLWAPWALFLVSWVILLASGGPGKGISVMPFGDHDEDSYPLQRKFGYNGAFVISIVIGLLLAAFFGISVYTTKQVWIPVPRMFAPGLQVPEFGAQALFSGSNAAARGLADSVPATAVENSVLIYSLMFFGTVIRYFFQALGIPPRTAALIGLGAWILIASISFPFIFHVFSYQSIEPAYWRAFLFVMMCGIPTALTGFPVFLFPHLANNFVASYFSIVGFGAVVPPFLLAAIPIIIIIKNKKGGSAFFGRGPVGVSYA